MTPTTPGATAATAFTIDQAPASFTASAAPSTAPYGTGVTLSAAGLPAGATGTVTFTSGATTLCSKAVSSGDASCTTGILPPGSYPVTATYSGDADYAGATASTSFTIDQAATSFTAAAAPSTAPYGTSVTLSATGLPLAATGTLTFTSGATTLCSAPVSAGSAICSTGTLAAARYPVTATYSGDANYRARRPPPASRSTRPRPPSPPRRHPPPPPMGPASPCPRRDFPAMQPAP